MARSGNITVENNFTRGLITEYTAMNFPENAVTEADNCVFSELGAVSRRPGIDYESSASVLSYQTLRNAGDSSISYLNTTWVEFKWFSVNNDGAVTFVVQQINSTIRFFESSNTISTGLKPFSIDLYTYRTAGVTRAQISAKPCQFTTGDGYLFVTHPLCNSIYVSYNSDTDTITVGEIDIEIRDIEGLDEDVPEDERPTVLTDVHKYNLYNQGWSAEIPTAAGGATFVALQAWDNIRTDFPSNADVWWLYKGSRGWVNFAYGLNPDDGVSPESLRRGNSPAPRGYYIYDAFNIDRSDKSGIPGLTGQSSGSARPSACAWYAGRVWYSGVNSSKYASSLYFSQLAQGPRQFGRCYQQNDPTSEVTFDIVDTDGGVIKLPLVERVVAMKVLGDALVVLATNCVYVVSGTANESFKTTNYTVQYITNIGALSGLSVVEIEGALVWWNQNGIYSMANGPNGFEVTNISKQTIQSFFDAIPTDNIEYVKGVYNRREQIVRWVFSTGAARYIYNRALDLNLASKAFYPHTFDETATPRICGLLSIAGETLLETEDLVTTSTGVVTDSVDDTYVIRYERSGPKEIFKFVLTGAIFAGSGGYTFGEMNNFSNVDWEVANGTGVSYSSYGLSGYRIRGEILRKFNSTPIAFTIENIDNSSCLVSGVWDYGARQSLKQELYRDTATAIDYIVRRVKVRGKGRSLQIKFESVGNAPFALVGWSSFDTGGTQP